MMDGVKSLNRLNAQHYRVLPQATADSGPSSVSGSGRHLGFLTGSHVDQTPHDLIPSIVVDAQKIDEFQLAPCQKLESLNMFINGITCIFSPLLTCNDPVVETRL